MTFSPPNSQAAYLQTSYYFPEDFDEARVTQIALFQRIAFAVNDRQIGFYDLTEQLIGQSWFTVGNPQVKRQAWRTCYQIGAIAAGATSTTAHGLTQVTAFTNIYGTAITTVPDNRPIPYASTVAVNQQISITITATNIVIVNGAAAPNITSAIVILEYLKN